MDENMKIDGREYQHSYEKQATYYDAIYEAQGKDYKKESQLIRDLIEKYKESRGNSLLDVGCGTGGHFPFLKEWYLAEGLDIDENMLQVARQRHPEIVFHQGNMVNFKLDKQYDAITCLFSAIGYVMNVANLQSVLKTFEIHTKPGGVVVIEPWFSPDQWKEGRPSAVFVDKPDLKIARMNVRERKGNISIINFHFLVAQQGRVEHFTEMHEIGLFTKDEYIGAFEKTGLQTIYDPEGITGRGLHIGVKQQ
jgi:ubiquinone/menaquinone biosynthesis C-methylase UbiE